MGDVMYLEGKRWYPKEMLRLSDEKIQGENVVFYKDRNYGIVYGFISKNKIVTYPKETTWNNLKNLIGDDEKYFKVFEKDITKEKVIDLLSNELKIKSYGSVSKTNIIKILNQFIQKNGYNVGSYSEKFGTKPTTKGNNKIYRAFFPTVSGDESYQLYSFLDELGFVDVKEGDRPYYFLVKHPKTNIRVEYAEGDITLYIPIK